MNKKKIVYMAILSALIWIIGCILMKNSELDIMTEQGFQADKKIGNTEITKSTGYDVEGNSYTVSEEDPKIFVDGFFEDLESVCITFDKPLEKNIKVQIYEEVEEGMYGEGNSVVRFAKKGEKNVYIDMYHIEECRGLRIDIDGDFSLDSVSLSKTDFYYEKTGEAKISFAGYIFVFVVSVFIAWLLTFKLNVVSYVKERYKALKAYDYSIKGNKKNIIKLTSTVLTAAVMLFVCINYESYERKYYLCITMAVYVILMNICSIKEHIAKVTATVILILGIMNILTVPVASYISYDDEIHYQRTVYLSHAFDGVVTEADVFLYNRCIAEKNNRSKIIQDTESLETLYSYGAVPMDMERDINFYRTMSYLPGAVTMSLARGIGCSFENVFYAGKLGNILLYSVLTYFAIRRVRSGKAIVAVLAMIPANIFLATAYAYDTFLTGFVMLAVSYIIGVIQDGMEGKKVSIKDMAVIIAAFVIGFSPKAVYFPMIIMALLIPKDCYESEKSRKHFFIACAAGMLFVMITFMLPFIVSGPGEGDARGGNLVNSPEQVKFILSNPIEYTKILLIHIKEYVSPERQIGTVGMYGHYGLTTHFVLMFGTIVAACFTDRSKKDEKSCKLSARVITGFAIFASLVLISTALYISYTAVGAEKIAGCGLRYLIPFMLPVCYFIFNVKQESKINKNIMYTVFLFIMTFIFCSDAWKLWISLYV